MRILLCNDDGIESEGIREFARVLAKENTVLVVAPDGNRSGYSHSMSFYKDLSVRRADFDGIEAYALTGTPADCVKFADRMLNFLPDVVIGGINVGSNLGSDTLYSGTVSVALEANCIGYKGIAFSYVDFGASDFKLVAPIAKDVLMRLVPHLSTDVIWNVNIPKDLELIKGIRIARLGKHIYEDYYEPMGEDTYQLRGEPLKHKYNEGDDCDVDLIRDGYITVTPILYDRTDYVRFNKGLLDINK